MFSFVQKDTDPSLNALVFEREVIDFFGPRYGFDLNDLAEYIEEACW